MARRNRGDLPTSVKGQAPAPASVPSAAMTRRAALQQLGVGVAALTVGCTVTGGPAGADSPDLSSAPPASDLAAPPSALMSAIDSVVVLMMENRSFDHFLGSLKLDATYPGRALLNGLTGTESNPDPAGMPVVAHRLDTYTVADPPHDWNAAHSQWDAGKNDGFVRAHAGTNQSDVMGYHERDQLPFLYALADRFTVCDRWHAAVMGPTWPNRYYLHSCTSNGKQDNTPFLSKAPATIWERMKDKGLAAKNYTAGAAAFYTGGYISKLLTLNPVVKFDEFIKDAQAGTLPPFAMIDPDFLTNDDHPSHNVQLGQAFMATIMAALTQSPQWARTLFVITYDEHGGFFDHVSPPKASDSQPGFDQLGFRVCSVVIGATVRTGAVNSTQYDHTSVAATLRTRFGITSLSQRMDAAADLSACLDPLKIGNPAPPPTDLPKVTLRLADALQFSGGHGQPELLAMMQNGAIPAQFIDQRSDTERTLSWLRAGQKLGALNLIE